MTSTSTTPPPLDTRDRTSLFADRSWTHLEAADLGEAALVPTMLNPEEQKYYVWLTREWATGGGAIVDLGSFAGGSTACLAEGVRQAGRDQIVHGYDKFVVNDFDVFQTRRDRYLSKYPASESPCTPRPMPPIDGTDLEPIVEFFLEPWGSRTTLIKGQIEETVWTGGDIEVLVMDASKAATTMEQMSRIFFPHLVPGESIVVQQDFLWWQQPWIAAQMAVFAEYFTPVAYVPNHSVSYLYTRKMDEALLASTKVSEMSDNELISWVRQSKQRLKSYGIDRHFRRLVSGIKANPEKRKAFQFTTKP